MHFALFLLASQVLRIIYQVTVDALSFLKAILALYHYDFLSLLGDASRQMIRSRLPVRRCI